MLQLHDRIRSRQFVGARDFRQNAHTAGPPNDEVGAKNRDARIDDRQAAAGIQRHGHEGNSL